MCVCVYVDIEVQKIDVGCFFFFFFEEGGGNCRRLNRN